MHLIEEPKAQLETDDDEKRFDERLGKLTKKSVRTATKKDSQS